jgi:hypothetical protein
MEQSKVGPPGPKHGKPVRSQPAVPRAAGQERLFEAYQEVIADQGRLRVAVIEAPRARRWPWMVAIVAVLAVGYFGVWRRLTLNNAAAPLITTPEQRKQEMQFLVLADQIARHLRQSGELPTTLSEAGIDQPTVGYEVRGGQEFLLRSGALTSRLELKVKVPPTGPLVISFIRPKS